MQNLDKNYVGQIPVKESYFKIQLKWKSMHMMPINLERQNNTSLCYVKYFNSTSQILPEKKSKGSKGKEVLMVEKTQNVDLECNLRDTVASIKYGLTLASLNVLLFR